MEKSILLIIILAFNNPIYGQNVICSGTVKENETQEILIGVSIRDVKRDRIIGNAHENGQFSIKLPVGQIKLEFSYTGYKSTLVDFYANEDTIIDVKLNAIELSEVKINAENINLGEKIGAIVLPMQQIKNVPALLGETDVLRALTALPGVSNGTEGSVGLNVRGGSPDQNLILLDGATIYNATHIFGFLSAFNTDAVKRVELIKGGFPAKYGGRLSSIIDINFKDGNKEKHNATAEIGILSAKLNIDGPIKKNKISYMFGFRTSYLDLLTARSKKNYRDTISTNYQNYNFYDVNAKVNFILKNNSALTFSFFQTADGFIRANLINAKQNESINTLRWNTTVGSIKFFQTFRKGMLFNSTLAYNRYFYDFGLSFRPIQKNASDKLDLTYMSGTLIHDLSWKNNFDYLINQKHTLNLGIDAIYQNFTPNITSVRLNGITNENQAKSIKSGSFNFYNALNSNWNEIFTSQIGYRISSYVIKDNKYIFIEPRASAMIDINKTSTIKISFDVMNQFVHLLSNNTLGFTNDAWLPSTKKVPPQNAIQYSLGYLKSVPKRNMYFSMEAYYKKLTNLIDYTEGTNPILDNATKNWEDIIQKKGIGNSYGLELLLRKETGKATGLIEYSWAKALRKFEKINSSEWYPYRFDRTHDIGISVSYQITKKFSFATNWIYTTGTPFSGGKYVYLDKSDKSNIAGGGVPIRLFFGSKNNLRLPAYKRVDLSITYQYKTKNNYTHKWSIGAYNLFNRYNPIAATQTLSEIGDYQGDKFIVNAYQTGNAYINLLRIIPYINYNFKIR